jgi:hypothetical protein
MSEDNRLRPIGLFDPIQIGGNFTQGLVPGNPSPFTFPSISSSFERIVNTVGMIGELGNG